MPAVVFVADDLGVSAGVNRGIARAAASGLVRESSLCVTGSAVVDGVRVARDLGVGIGLHLSLTLGKSLTGRIRGLTDRDGHFRPLGRALLRTFLRAVDRDAVAREVRAQLERAITLAGPLTHVNGHHHVHVMPVVRDVVFAAVAAASVRWTRLPREHRSAGGRWRPQTLLLASLSRRSEPGVRAHGLRTLPFVGITTEARADFLPRARKLAASLPAEPVEWMVHPHEPDDAMLKLDPMGHRRPAAAELSFLADPTCAERCRLRPLRYADLPSA